MEYFLGSIVTLATIYIVNVLIRRNVVSKDVPIMYTQSRLFSIMQPFIAMMPIAKRLNTQSAKHFESLLLRILYLEGIAYWIESNKLVQADVSESGEIDHSTQREVDTMGMDDVQLKKTMFIVEKLREGFDNDSGYTGNQKF